MEIQASSEFATWAKGYSGFDGGNQNGKIWICGIEPGGKVKEDDFQFSDASRPGEIHKEELHRNLKPQYNRKAAKLYASITGDLPENYEEVAHRVGLFSSNSDVFKINLYPLAFKNSNEAWEQWIYKKTGIPTRSLYRAWCQLYRFPAIKYWMQQSAPRLIICTSKAYRDDFILAFSGPDQLSDHINVERVGGRSLEWKMINEDQTILAITPFLGGRWGLNSDRLLEDFGRKLSALCDAEFGKAWLS